MRGLTAPTLVLHRAGDFLPLRDARRVAEVIPGATLVVLPGNDHLPWVGDGHAVVEHVLAFAASVSPRRQRSAASKATARSAPPRRSGPLRRTGGRLSLTDAERAVVSLVSEGLTNREIAERLFLSRYTVETHLKHLFSRLGVRSRTELAALVLTPQSGPASRNT